MAWHVLLLAFPMQWAALTHPLHVSVTEIEVNEKERRLQIMMRVFIDDLELSLRNHFKQPDLDALSPAERSLDVLMRSYLADRFQIWLDGKAQVINYLGSEPDRDALVFYIEVDKMVKWKSIQVKNTIIMEIHDDQSNLVHVTVGETVRSIRLTHAKPVDLINFEH